MKTKLFLLTGSIIPVVFWMTILICGYIMGDYDHYTRFVSELGASGTKTQYIFLTGFILCSILSIMFISGLYRMCKLNRMSVIPVIIILVYTFSIAGVAFFPLPSKLHGILGIPSLLLVMSPVMSLILWSGEPQIKYMRLTATISILITAVGFLTFIPDILSYYPGLKQRFFHAGWSVWFLYLSYIFIKLAENKKSSS